MTTLRPRHGPRVRLDDLVTATPGVSWSAGSAGDTSSVTGVTLDSRRVAPGDLYAALPGARVHGAQFAAAALEAGAVAVLTDARGAGLLTEAGVEAVPVLLARDPRAVLGQMSSAVYGHPSAALATVGITGTNGKTTTAYIIEAGLRQCGVTTGLIGTIETRILGESVASERTTPESSDVHGLLAVMVERGVQACCMEVSSHALDLHRVDGVRFDVAVFTNLSQDHLDFHSTMAGYFAAKASLFTPQRSRRGIVCVDDEWGRRLAAEADVPVTTLASAAAAEADWRIVAEPGAARFHLDGPGGEVLALTSGLPGDHNRTNTGLAALVLRSRGIPGPAVEAALAVAPTVPGRMELVDLGPGAPRVYVDFAHTPGAVTAALRSLRPLARGRLVVVVGAGGDRDPGKRAAMGAAAAADADEVVVTDDNPRREDPGAIREALLGGARAARGGCAGLIEVAGRAAGIGEALRRAGHDGVVAILGKGHEVGQTIGDTTEPFDDRLVVREAWRRRAAHPVPPAQAAGGGDRR